MASMILNGVGAIVLAALIGFFGSAFMKPEVFTNTRIYVIGISVAGAMVSGGYAYGRTGCGSLSAGRNA